MGTIGYRSGRRNIGPQQRRRRLLVSIVPFGAAAAIVHSDAPGYLPGPLLAAVFVPLAVGFERGLQASTAVCVRLALPSSYDLGGADDGAAGTVSDPVDSRADRLQAAKLTCVAIGVAAVGTVLLAIVP